MGTTILFTVLVTLVLLQVTNFCTTVYLHRTLAHRAIQLHPAVAFSMRLWMWVFNGLNPREWVAVHRKHHRYADQEGDPHSPYLKGLWTILLWNYVYYMRECNNKETVEKFGSDIPGSFLDRVPWSYKVGPMVGMLILMALLGWIPGFVAFWAHALTYISLSAAINGAGHAVGYRNFDNTATNIRTLALLTAGEGLHNNHHEFPVSAKFSVRPSELDPAWPFIRILRAMKLATTSTSTPA